MFGQGQVTSAHRGGVDLGRDGSAGRCGEDDRGNFPGVICGQVAGDEVAERVSQDDSGSLAELVDDMRDVVPRSSRTTPVVGSWTVRSHAVGVVGRGSRSQPERP
jgi:hypothetical protein